MALDLNEVAQSFLRANTNIDNVFNQMWDMYYNPTPLDITIPYVNPDGTIVNKTIPNRAKVKEQIWNDAQSAMSKTFYVDAVNGSDDNDGTEDAPFKTLKKAIDGIPVGGMGYIYLLSDINLNENILVDNKVIDLVLNNYVLNVQSFSDDIDNYYFGFNLRKSSISISSGEINLSGKANADLPWQYGAMGAVFKGDHPAGVNFVRIGYATLNMPSDAGTLCASGIGNWAIITHLLLESVDIKRDGGYIYNIQTSHGVGSLSVNGTSLQDGAGNYLSWTDVISGIIRDANGVPRNILSNIVL